MAEVEQRWRDRFGGDVIDAIPDPEAGMPWAPPEVHAPDGFRTHVIEGQRADKDNPLVVRLGQGLTHLTIRHEQNTRVSLPLAANVLRVVGDAVVPVRDLPKLTGLSKEAIAMAVGFLLRRNLAATAPDRTVRLTDGGIDAHDEYRKARSEDDELRGALEGVLAQREALVSGLVPPEGCWRGQRPHLERTKRVLADPTGSLPWHPMVLHRGGWPDGS